MKTGICWLYAIELFGYPPSIEDTGKALERISKLGFKYTEIEAFGFEKKGNIKELHQGRKEVKKRVDDLGLKIINLPMMLPGLVSLDPSRRKKAKELFNTALEIAVYLESDMASFCSFTPDLEFIGERPYETAISYGYEFRIKVDPGFSWDRQWSILIDSFSWCNENLKKAGIQMLIEPRVGEIVPNTDSVLRLIDGIKDSNFGAILEVAHLHGQREILPLSVEKLGERIRYIHVADNDGRDNSHNIPGDGTVDWEQLLLALRKHSFSGYFLIDVRSRKKERMDKDYVESKQFLEKLEARL